MLAGTKKPFTFQPLIHQNQVFETPSKISELLAKTYAKMSPNSNYDSKFISYKLQEEKTPIDFDSSSSSSTDFPYNLPISENEVRQTISTRSKKSAPGVDQISPAMLHNLNDKAIIHLTSLFNRVLQTSTFPPMWKIAEVIPLLKPSKDPSLPLSYRPISLLSALGKILEKIMNSRLVWYLESNNILSNTQYGCRKGRSTLMALADLDTQISEAKANQANLYSVFFDMESAFPRVWTYHVCSCCIELVFVARSPSYCKISYKIEPFGYEQPIISHPPMNKRTVYLKVHHSAAHFSYSPLMISPT